MQIRQTFQKYHFVVFFILVAMESMAANFAHPITAAGLFFWFIVCRHGIYEFLVFAIMGKSGTSFRQ